MSDGRAADARLADFYFADPRLVLVPVEHLTASGTSAAFAALVAERRGWTGDRIALFDRGFDLYWTRSEALARRTRTWPMPRRRHIAVVADPLAVRPYVQLLNTSAWMLYDCDLDPTSSDPELVAYLLVLGDRMALSGEVATAPLHAAAYWLERTDDERAAYAAAAARSPRPDVAVLCAVGDAEVWLRRLGHETLAPRATTAGDRGIPGTGLVVPSALTDEPARFVERCADGARHALATYAATWRASSSVALTALTDWLASALPRVLVTGRGGSVLWDSDEPGRLGALRRELRGADAIAVEAMHADLAVVDERTRAFHAALVDPEGLSDPEPGTAQSGYSYLHRERRMIAYNLHEAGMERLHGPALPYARAMLAARTVHEWAHLAVDAGWVPLAVDARTYEERAAAFARDIDAAVAAAHPTVLRATRADLDELTRGAASAGDALARVLIARMPDYQANLLACRFLHDDERETYVRHNVRTLRHEYPPARLWRMLVRYLYEYQYLGFSGVEDRRAYLFGSTWFDRDFLESGALDISGFDRLAAATAALCACYAVDARRFR